MTWGAAFTSGTGTPDAVRPPAQCTCARDRTVATLDATLGCPGKWYETGGWWVHAWPRRRRGASRHRGTETTTRGNTP